MYLSSQTHQIKQLFSHQTSSTKAKKIRTGRTVYICLHQHLMNMKTWNKESLRWLGGRAVRAAAVAGIPSQTGLLCQGDLPTNGTSTSHITEIRES
jgi:hypothetical protein